MRKRIENEGENEIEMERVEKDEGKERKEWKRREKRMKEKI